MKVILLKDVPAVGKRFEVKDVADGHALNFLFPKKLAEMASDKAMARLDKMKAVHDADRSIHEDLLIKNLKSIEGVTVTVTHSANEKGHLFAGIHKEEIIPAIKEQTHVDVLADYLVMPKPIKEVGEFDMEVKVQDKTATFKLIVQAAA